MSSSTKNKKWVSFADIEQEQEPLLNKNKNNIRRNKQRATILIALLSCLLLGSIVGVTYFSSSDKNFVNEVNKATTSGDEDWLEEPTKLVKGLHGGVASEQGDCSEIGVDILKEGGSAVDSAIATALCIGTINGFSSGIGGGGFTIIRTPSGNVEHIDFRESAPAASNKTMYDKRPEQVQVGGLAVGVPGEIKGFELMHRKYGKLPWSKLFAPSAKLCKEGFRAGTELVRQLNLGKEWILENEEFRKVYVKNGELIDVGDIVKRPGLGATLEKIGKEGSSAFYEGEIAREIVDFTQKNGGILTLQDLKNYKPIIRPYAEGKFFNSTIISTTAPSAGSILISTLQLLEEVIKTNGKGSTTEVYHKFIESLKFGFAMRTKIADPDFDSEISKFSELILTKDYIKNLATEVDLASTHNFDYYHPQYDTKELPGTTHISVIDSTGLVVSLTSTVNLEFGSHLMTPLSGIILNDEMDDFSLPNVTNGFNLPPSPLNWVQPHKRPLSSTVPTIVVSPNGDIISLGGSGGTRILSAVAQILLEVEVNGKDLNSAIDTPRIHHQLIPETIFLEKAFDQDIINGLYTKGHNVTRWPRHKSVVQIVKRSSKDGTIEALSDGRKHGLAHVY